MTDAQMLEALMKRASDSSYGGPSYQDYLHFDSVHLNDIIFNHDFARALFGEDNYDRLMQAVISPNPIKYMYEAVFGE